MDRPVRLLRLPIGRRRVLPVLALAAAADGRAREVGPGQRPGFVAATAVGVDELMVPFPAGGSMDAIGRVLASALGDRLVVSNVGGASGAVGVRRFLQRPADGRALLLASLTQLLLPSDGHGASTRLLPIGKVSSTDFVIVSGLRFAARTLDEFVDRARARPGRVSLAHPGQATMQYLSARLVEERAGIDLLLVPYSGSAPMLADLVAGQVDTALIAVPGAMPLVRAGRLKVLGLLRDRPSPASPQWPVGGDSHSLDGVNAAAWLGLFGIAGTPGPRIDDLRGRLAEALRSPALRTAVESMGSFPARPDRADDAAEFPRFVEREVARYGELQRAVLQQQRKPA